MIGLYAYEGSAHKNNGKVEQIMPHDKGSLEEIMGAGMGAAQFINLRDTTLGASTEWMYTPRTAKAWGVLNETMIPREQYDGILLIQQLHPSTPVKRLVPQHITASILAGNGHSLNKECLFFECS
ncbi:erythromycin esterase family protein [Paenibacillus rhizoplanae]